MAKSFEDNITRLEEIVSQLERGDAKLADSLKLFEEADLPTYLLPGIVCGGMWTFAMTGPFSPQICNIVSMQSLGTPSYAGLIPGLAVSVVMAVLIVWYMNRQAKKAKGRGEHFTPPEGGVRQHEGPTPGTVVSFVPLTADGRLSAKAEKAGLSKILAARKAAAKPAAEAETVTAPPAEPCTASIPGIEVMDLEDAVQALWKAGIYAESGMGCTGPLVMMSEANHEKALEILKKAGYVG